MITNRKNALLSLAQQQQGKVSDLVQNIAPDLIESFRALGFISLSEDKWCFTSTGEDQCRIYREPTSRRK